MLKDLAELFGRRCGDNATPPRRSRKPTRSLPTNLNSLLQDIYERYIAINDQDFQTYYSVVSDILRQMHEAMKEEDPYYGKYSSKVQYAGSHYDHLRINKPDEFDIDIVIGLPLNIKQNPQDPAESDIVIEPSPSAGFVQLKMGVQYQRLQERFRSTEWRENSAAWNWHDNQMYLLSSEFMNWFKGVVDKALRMFANEHGEPVFDVDGHEYFAKKSGSGPALTLLIEDHEGFRLDVDLVPALQFPASRWPVSSEYRPIPKRYQRVPLWQNRNRSLLPKQSSTNNGTFMLVAKPNKAARSVGVRNRSWRAALPDQERMIMHNTNNMRQAIRLMKQVRDSNGMDKISSYCIKTLFFWEAMEHTRDKEFWDNNPADLLQYMLGRLYGRLVTGDLPYFWNRKNNLFEAIDAQTLQIYAKTVQKVQTALRTENCRRVARYLLTKTEYERYYPRLQNL